MQTGGFEQEQWNWENVLAGGSGGGARLAGGRLGSRGGWVTRRPRRLGHAKTARQVEIWRMAGGQREDCWCSGGRILLMQAAVLVQWKCPVAGGGSACEAGETGRRRGADGGSAAVGIGGSGSGSGATRRSGGSVDLVEVVEQPQASEGGQDRNNYEAVVDLRVDRPRN
ncbi:hypothetical protein Syun_004346 [Stephania yunnanensis]|uniref:Uncharacterized protein n=1 Tax=Stephania yunnanensis TaxID=152371 RepID=A0AAP0L664_9MAGN